jgi:hypothetical protein
VTGLEPFSPDRPYCVYCHAPAAGMCAGCGAICCAECTELVMGISTQQALCGSCLRDGRRPAGMRRFLGAAAAAAVLLTGVLLLLVYT